MPPRDAAPDFDLLADRYDRLRPADGNWQALLDVLWEAGGFAGRTLLDVGCGTGRLAAAFAARGATVTGVDLSAEMLERAAAATRDSVRLVQAGVEELPFPDGSFERALLHLVVHLVERSRALPELARVLTPGGRLVIATFQPGYFDRIWLARRFPSLAQIDRARFPDPEVLARELVEAGFYQPTIETVVHEANVEREAALEKLRGRFISTLWLLPEEEYREGVARAERELAPVTVYPREWAIVVAERR